jgi:hypothetical protein
MYIIMVRKYFVIRPLDKPSRRWKGNIKMGLREIGCEDRLRILSDLFTNSANDT